MLDIRTLESFCKEIKCEYRLEAPMSELTTFRIGGPASFLAVPDSVDKLKNLIQYCLDNEADYYIVGKGSNILVSDSGIKGVVILTSALEGITYEGDGRITCLAGTPLIRLCSFALENSLSGLEFAYGIPGSAGGAVFMNAGAYGGEMKDAVVSVSHIDKYGNIGSFDKDCLDLGYRRSVYSDGDYVITGTTVILTHSDRNEIKAKMDDLLSRRKAKQPLDYPSAGSTFKRPEGFFAGALIEQCGLKGFCIGGAQVSEKHAGFVINKGGATAEDVLSLVDYVKETVYKNTGVELEPEIKFIG
ncbi:MAG: UDP-N-acetylmuramate dehydrogenase [Clostridia bacterium]|nr:UDP-N-acetylmuramate dehydrogenase [Clostridia bacterium]